MSLAHWTSSHRHSLLFLLVLATLAGAISAFSLPVALFPHIEFPRVSISLDTGDRPVVQTVNDVTRPVEQAVKSVPGIREVRSVTSRGSADISLNFDWGGDMDVATLQIQSALSRVLPSLPPDTSFEVRRMNPTALFPVAAYGLTSKTLSPAVLRELAQDGLIPLLSSLEGVASVEIMGGAKRELRVNVDPALLLSYGLSLDDITKALASANVLKAVGRIEDRHKLLLVMSDTQTDEIDKILHTIIRNGSDGIIELEDIASVNEDTEPQTSLVQEDGKPAVIVQIFQQPDGNTVQVVKDVKTALGGYSSKLPKGVELSNWYDQSQLILQSATTVRDAILIGVALAAVILFLFLRNALVTLAAVIVVPAVLAATVLLLGLWHMSFNIMTLGGMAAAIGLVVDDAIVMIEQIVRHLKTGDTDPHRTIRKAASEFLVPLAGSSAATVVIFLPLAFLDGVTGAFFKALSLTMASALVVSFFVAWFAIPLLADRLLSGFREHAPSKNSLQARITASYRTALTRCLKAPLLVCMATGLLLVLGLVAYLRIGSGFMPAMDEGGFIIDYISAPGTSLSDTDALLNQVGDILKATSEVMTYSRRTGEQLGGGLTEPNTGDFFVRLKPAPRRDIEDIMAEVRGKVATQVPGLDIEMLQLMEDVIGDLTAVPQPVEIKIFGDDADNLRETADKVVEQIGHIKGVVDISSGVVLAGDALEIHVDHNKAALEGLDPAAVTSQLDAYLSGTVATTIQKGIQTVGVRVWVPLKNRSSPEQILRLPIDAPDGHKVPLGRIAEVHLATGQPEIVRDNLKTMVAVTARIEGRDLGSTIKDVRQLLNKPGLFPQETYYTLGGLYAQQQAAFKGLLSVLAASVALVFLLLLFLYEDFRIALSIILMPLLAMSVVFIGLCLTGIELNISAMMGMTMVVGIVTEVAIFYFSEFKAMAAREKASHEMLVNAGVSRFRPVAMTTLAAILALLPLALDLGQGSAMQKPLAVAIISGLCIQMPLVLLVMPVLYARLARISRASHAD